MLNYIMISLKKEKVDLRMNDLIFKKLSLSKFRNSFKLKDSDLLYIKDKGMDVIRKHAVDIIKKRLAPSLIINDGKQTPMKGHPVFIAQHATATCCRECLYKWHKIEKNKELNNDEINYIVDLIIVWIEQHKTA